jgi:GTP cyclohydrolase I
MSKDCLPDVQCSEPNIQIPIMQVGVENVEVPFKIESRYGGFHETIANVAIRTSIDGDTKGISMSRLLLTLKPYLDLPLKSRLIKEILEKIIENVETSKTPGMAGAYMTFDFRIPIIRHSVISDNQFPLYYKCRFEGQVYDVDILESDKVTHRREWYFRFFEGVKIQYASYCPCSAELCSVLDSRGFPHNQRSFADIMVETDTLGNTPYVWLEDIIESVEDVIPTLPYPIIKRVDEQEIARIAGENPMFVEDAIRLISQSLTNIDGVIDWIVKCSHEESIHTSEAIAVNWKGVFGGFDGRRYL